MRASRSGEMPTVSGVASVKNGDFFCDLVWAEIPEKMNLLAIGPTGSGKTYLLQKLGDIKKTLTAGGIFGKMAKEIAAFEGMSYQTLSDESALK